MAAEKNGKNNQTAAAIAKRGKSVAATGMAARQPIIFSVAASAAA
jgi:hypothetical protein